MHKIWHKPKHKRKVWKHMTLLSKVIYYMQPFMEHLIEVWLQPLPFPTILKCAYSCFLLLFLMLPLLYPTVIIACHYAMIQHFAERGLGLPFPDRLDLIHFTEKTFTYKMSAKEYDFFHKTYIERCRYLAAAFASCVDYIRLALTITLG